MPTGSQAFSLFYGTTSKKSKVEIFNALKLFDLNF